MAVYTRDESLKQLFSAYILTGTLNSLSNQQYSTSTTSSGSANDQYGGMAGNVLNVYSDGTVKIPYLGKIRVEGLTILEAKSLIASRFNSFSEGVSVDITLNNRYFSFLGELGYSRVFMDKQRLNIFQALARAGKVSDVGNREQVYIIRQTGGGSTEYKTFDLRSKDILDSEYFYIQPNDVIYMPKINKTFFGRISNFWDIFNTVTATLGISLTVILLYNEIFK